MGCPCARIAADAAAADADALASAPDEVRLRGTSSHKQFCLGKYERVVGRQCGGRAVYRQGSPAGHQLPAPPPPPTPPVSVGDLVRCRDHGGTWADGVVTQMQAGTMHVKRHGEQDDKIWGEVEATADIYLSFSNGSWRVSKNSDIGTIVSWMNVGDDARHPNDILASWQEYDGTAWVAAKPVSCVLEGKSCMLRSSNWHLY